MQPTAGIPNLDPNVSRAIEETLAVVQDVETRLQALKLGLSQAIPQLAPTLFAREIALASTLGRPTLPTLPTLGFNPYAGIPPQAVPQQTILPQGIPPQAQPSAPGYAPSFSPGFAPSFAQPFAPQLSAGIAPHVPMAPSVVPGVSPGFSPQNPVSSFLPPTFPTLGAPGVTNPMGFVAPFRYW
jgi:hypothetical protein